MSSGVVSNVVIYFVSRKIPVCDMRPLPAAVRYSFYAFILAIITVGIGLVLKMPNIMPWQISDEGSVVYGWLFLGASVYFVYATVKPRWENAAGPLLGFLAYDIVLILPFIRHFSDVRPEHLRSLIVYTSVVSSSGLLAIYYLFINRQTRLFEGAGSVQPVDGTVAR